MTTSLAHICAGIGQGQNCNQDPCRWVNSKGDKMNWTQLDLFDTIEVTTTQKEENATIHHTSN